jgi:hypothetical protein
LVDGEVSEVAVFCEPPNSWKQSGRRVARLRVARKPKFSDAHEPRRQQVEQEAAQELIDSKGHEPFLVAVG